MTNAVADSAVQKLVSVMGPQRANAIVSDALRELSLPELRNADDCLRFGDVLVQRGGLLSSIGRAIKIQAILHGASEQRGPTTPPRR